MNTLTACFIISLQSLLSSPTNATSTNPKEFSSRVFVTIPTAELPESAGKFSDSTSRTTYAKTTEVPVKNLTLEEKSLLKTRQLEEPQLFFLADDPKAASKIPEFLTTFYDNENPDPIVGPSQIEDLIEGRSGGIYPPTTQPTELTTDPFSIELEDLKKTVNSRDKSYRGHKNFFSSRPNVLDRFSDALETHGKSGNWRQGNNNITRVTNIEAECQNDFMKINIKFNGTFEGMIYSSGYSHDFDCVYVSGSGRNSYEFFIKLNRCGTLNSNENVHNGQPINKNIMWNTLTVQYNPLIEEEWDEHFKVTCEYGLEIWKTVTFPFLDVEVQPGNPMTFSLNPPECHMEIRYGFDLRGREVAGPVRVGEPLTLVIYMKSEYDGFDIIVSDCYAHNGGAKRIKLIDSYGCPVDDKLISHFEGQSVKNSLFETRVFAFMKTFRFTGSPALYLECSVRMCHGECPEQACHWRLRSDRIRRATPVKGDSRTNVSDSMNLFQALQVIREDQPQKNFSESPEDSLCMSLLNVFVVSGLAAATFVLMATTCIVLCLRVRSFRKDPNYPVGIEAFTPKTPKSNFIPSSKRRLE